MVVFSLQPGIAIGLSPDQWNWAAILDRTFGKAAHSELAQLRGTCILKQKPGTKEGKAERWVPRFSKTPQNDHPLTSLM